MSTIPWKILHAQLTDLQSKVTAGWRVHDARTTETIARVEFNPAVDQWRVAGWEEEGVMADRYVSKCSPPVTISNFSQWLESLEYWERAPNSSVTVRNRLELAGFPG